MRRSVLALASICVACTGAERAPTAGAAAANASPTAPAATMSAVDAAPPDAACPGAAAPAAIATVQADDVDEASGIAASAVNPGAYWAHNDSGDSARAFALSSTGELLATMRFDAAPAVDIEDMAIEDSEAGGFLYFGDIGDNAVARASVTIHRVAEPRLDGTRGATLAATSEKMTVKYGDAPHDAETLLFDPVTKDLFIVTKVAFGKAQVHRVGPFAAGTTATTTKIASVPVTLATGGEIARDASLVAIRGYGTSAAVWRRAPGEDLATALARPPCAIPVAAEGQGEAFAFLPDGGGYVTVSEGASPKLHLARFD